MSTSSVTQKPRKPAPNKAASATPLPETPQAFFGRYFKERGSSLAAAQRESSRIFTASEMQAAGYRNQFAAPAISFPCVDPVDGSLIGQGRVRYVEPPIDSEGEPRKFNQPYGVEALPYITYRALSDWSAVVKDVRTDLYIGEGETRALAAAQHGLHLIATGGVDNCFVSGTHRGKLIPWFDKIKWKGRRVFICNDADAKHNPSVREATRCLAALLTERGAQVRIVNVPSIAGPKDGLDDLLAHDGIGVFRWACEIAPVWSENSDSDWPEPEPLGTLLHPVEKMTPDMLPEKLRPWTVNQAKLLQVPLDFIGALMVLSVGAATMRGAKVRPQRNTRWVEYPNLWGGVVADPATMKSAALQTAIQPIREIQARFRREYARAQEEHFLKRERYEVDLAKWKSDVKKDASAKRPEIVPENPPPARTLVTNDATVEALHQLLADNPSGVSVISDELATVFMNMSKIGRETERKFYLEAWRGDASYTMHRQTRPSVHVENAAVAIIGNIQPGPLRKHLTEQTSDEGEFNDGFTERFSILVWPDTTTPKWIDEKPDTKAEAKVKELFEMLVKLNPDSPLDLHFDDAAQVEFIAWYEEHMRRATDPAMSSHIRSHLSKYKKLVPALALLFSIADDEVTAIGVKHLRMALQWAQYLESHMRRIYSLVESRSKKAARTLARHLQTTLPQTFSVRELYKAGWQGLSDKDVVRGALAVLEDYGWVRKMKTQASAEGGRPSETYTLNPKVTMSYPNINGQAKTVFKEVLGGYAGGKGGTPSENSNEFSKRGGGGYSGITPQNPSPKAKTRKFTRSHYADARAAARKGVTAKRRAN